MNWSRGANRYLGKMVPPGIYNCCLFGIDLSNLDDFLEEKIPKAINPLLWKLEDLIGKKGPKWPNNRPTKADWSGMLRDWFFEKGLNPKVFSQDSLHSQDLASSFAMEQVAKEWHKQGKPNKFNYTWQFVGPETATGNYGAVEWFIGSFKIEDFKVLNKTKYEVSFTVRNASTWHSATRLPKSWIQYIKNLTGLTITNFVTNAPRGKTVRSKLQKLLKFKIPASFPLPSFGGNWDQEYKVKTTWPPEKKK